MYKAGDNTNTLNHVTHRLMPTNNHLQIHAGEFAHEVAV